MPRVCVSFGNFKRVIGKRITLCEGFQDHAVLMIIYKRCNTIDIKRFLHHGWSSRLWLQPFYLECALPANTAPKAPFAHPSKALWRISAAWASPECSKTRSTRITHQSHYIKIQPRYQQQPPHPDIHKSVIIVITAKPTVTQCVFSPTRCA